MAYCVKTPRFVGHKPIDSPDGLGDGYLVDRNRHLGESQDSEGADERAFSCWVNVEYIRRGKRADSAGLR